MCGVALTNSPNVLGIPLRDTNVLWSLTWVAPLPFIRRASYTSSGEWGEVSGSARAKGCCRQGVRHDPPDFGTTARRTTPWVLNPQRGDPSWLSRSKICNPLLPRRRAVVFVHGCFWHRHLGCVNAVAPKTRPEFWRAKLDGNTQRDLCNAAALKELGWRVIVVWECELEGERKRRCGRIW